MVQIPRITGTDSVYKIDKNSELTDKNLAYRKSKMLREVAGKKYEHDRELAESRKLEEPDNVKEYSQLLTSGYELERKNLLNSKTLKSTQHLIQITNDLSNESWANFLQNAEIKDLCPILDNLLSEIESDTGFDTDSLLTKFEAKMKNKNKAQFYVGLNYFQDNLKKIMRQTKHAHNHDQVEKVLNEFEEAKVKYTKHNFEYLVNYFVSSSNNDEENNEIVSGVSSDAATLLKINKLNLTGVKQVIAFVIHGYQGEIEKLLSLFLRVKAANIEILTTEVKLSPGYKLIAQEIRSIRWVLQIYREIFNIETRLSRYQAKLLNKNQFAQALIEFIDAKFWSEFTMNNLIRNNFTGLTSEVKMAELFLELIIAIPIAVIYGPKKKPEILKFLNGYALTQKNSEQSKLISVPTPLVQSAPNSKTHLAPLGQASVVWLYLLYKNKLSQTIIDEVSLHDLEQIEQYLPELSQHIAAINQILKTMTAKLIQLNQNSTGNNLYTFNNLHPKDNQISKKILELTTDELPLLDSINFEQLKNAQPKELKLIHLAKDIFYLQEKLNLKLGQGNLLKDVSNLFEYNLHLIKRSIACNQQLKMKVGFLEIEPNFHLNEFYAEPKQLTGLKMGNSIQLLPFVMANELKYYLQDHTLLIAGLAQAINNFATTGKPDDLLVDVSKSLIQVLALEANQILSDSDGVWYSAMQIICSKSQQKNLDTTLQRELKLSLVKQKFDRVSKCDQIVDLCSQIPYFTFHQLILMYKFELSLQSVAQKLNLQSKCGQFNLLSSNKLIHNLPAAGLMF